MHEYCHQALLQSLFILFILANMNRSIASLLIIFILSMHSAWAIGASAGITHLLDSNNTHLVNQHQQSVDNSDAKDCEKHGCHISAHATGIFSDFNFALSNNEQDLDATVKQSHYFYSQTTPQRPPKV
jgi:hypothetical protein